jgi:nitroreductase
MALSFEDVLTQRRSIRAFEDKDVPEALLQKIFEQALMSPSSSNTQPYKLAVAKGAVRDAIRADLTNKFVKASQIQRMPFPKKLVHGAIGRLSGGVLPDGDFKTDLNYPPELKKRAVECGVGLYGTLGIKREDYAARQMQMQRNFELFDAPVAVFIFVHAQRGVFSALDAGMFMQSLMFSAVSEGLGTCAQGALATWASPVYKHFKVGEEYKLICGLSLGYPKDEVVNTYRPEKMTVDELCFQAK